MYSDIFNIIKTTYNNLPTTDKIYEYLFNKEYFYIDKLSVQIYSLKIMYNNETIKDKSEQIVLETNQRCRFYPKIKFSSITLKDVKVYENIGDYNQIQIGDINIKKPSKFIINYFRGKGVPPDSSDYHIMEYEE